MDFKLMCQQQILTNRLLSILVNQSWTILNVIFLEYYFSCFITFQKLVESYFETTFVFWLFWYFEAGVVNCVFFVHTSWFVFRIFGLTHRFTPIFQIQSLLFGQKCSNALNFIWLLLNLAPNESIGWNCTFEASILIGPIQSNHKFELLALYFFFVHFYYHLIKWFVEVYQNTVSLKYIVSTTSIWI